MDLCSGLWVSRSFVKGNIYTGYFVRILEPGMARCAPPAAVPAQATMNKLAPLGTASKALVWGEEPFGTFLTSTHLEPKHQGVHLRQDTRPRKQLAGCVCKISASTAIPS